jgi:hypothetical protein
VDPLSRSPASLVEAEVEAAGPAERPAAPDSQRPVAPGSDRQHPSWLHSDSLPK